MWAMNLKPKDKDIKNLGIFDLPNLYKLMDELIEKKGRTE